jgi:hypothetical protein
MTITTNYVREITYGEPLIPPPIQFILDTNKNGKFFDGLLPQDIEDKIFKLASTTAVPYKHAPTSWKRIMDNTLVELMNCFESVELCIELGMKTDKRRENTKKRYSLIAYDNYYRAWLKRLGISRHYDIPFLHDNIFYRSSGKSLVEDVSGFGNSLYFAARHAKYNHLYNTFTPNSSCGRRRTKPNANSECLFVALFNNVSKEQLKLMFEDNGLQWRKSWSIKKCIQALMEV